MSETIRMRDSKLVEILRNELQEFVPVPIPNKNLESTVYVLINYMRKNSRAYSKVIYIDVSSYWEPKDKNFYHNDIAIELTPKEKKLLALLFKNINFNVNYNSISIELWGNIEDNSHCRIKTLVKQVRKKLPKNIIKNIFSYGYKIEI